MTEVLQRNTDTFPIGHSAQCCRNADPQLHCKNGAGSTVSSVMAAEAGHWQTVTKDSGSESNISTMKEAVCSMGIPEDIVQVAINIQLLDHGSGFTKVTDLYMAAEDIFHNFEKRESLKARLSLAEGIKKAKTQHKDDLRLKSEDGCCTSEAPANRLAEMLNTAEAEVVSVKKSQLRRKAMKLARENRRLKERKFCRACKKVELSHSGVTFLPCGHFITCEACAELYDDCPACGKSIMGTVRTFLS